MRKAALCILIPAMIMIGCKKKDAATSRSEIIEGIRHVYNTGVPARGKTALEVAEVLRISPQAADQASPPLFQAAAKDGLGNIYLADNQNAIVYKFDSAGKSVARFPRKGQGPGEFPAFGDIQIVEDHLWIIGAWPLKIAKLTLDGQFVNEWNFRTFRNFYLRTLVVGEDRFLTVSYRDAPEGKERVRVSALVNSSEEFLTQYYADPGAGIFRIKTAQQEGPAIASTNPLVAADIHHACDRETLRVFVCNNRNYEISVKNADGTTHLVIHNVHQKINLDEAAKERVLGLIAPRIRQEAIKPAGEQLPGVLNAIWGIAALRRGGLAVKRITGIESVEIDLFDQDGRLLYTILPSAEIPDLKDVIFFKDTIGHFRESDEGNVFVELRVKNIKGIWD
jgi:hypothetical protein